MKRILIVNRSMHTGGIGKSLINFLNQINGLYKIDLYLFNTNGQFMKDVPKNVNVLTGNFLIKSLGMNKSECKKNLFIFLFRIFSHVWIKFFKSNRFPVFLAINFQKKLKNYDVVISFTQNSNKKQMYTGCNNFVDKKVNAKKKIAFIHADYASLGLTKKEFVKEYYNFDKIICVSKSCKEQIYHIVPEFKNKLDWLYNFQPVEEIKKLSEAKSDDFKIGEGINIVSVSRLSHEKAHLRTLDVFYKLKKENLPFTWHIIGDGPLKEKLQNKINEYELTNNVILYGNKKNPYTYMNKCNLFLLGSYLEAAPMTINEALILGIPVLTTKTLSSNEMVSDGVNGIICENSEEDLYIKLRKLIIESNLLMSLKDCAMKFQYNNSKILEKLVSEVIE